jgi:hypothetical protein
VLDVVETVAVRCHHAGHPAGLAARRKAAAGTPVRRRPGRDPALP